MPLIVSHLVSRHLEDTQAYAHLLFIDFSSAFNKLQPKILIRKLKQSKVYPFCIKWFYSFLTNRTQQVRVNNCYSEVKITNMVASQLVHPFCLLYILMNVFRVGIIFFF